MDSAFFPFKDREVQSNQFSGSFKIDLIEYREHLASCYRMSIAYTAESSGNLALGLGHWNWTRLVTHLIARRLAQHPIRDVLFNVFLLVY